MPLVRPPLSTRSHSTAASVTNARGSLSAMTSLPVVAPVVACTIRAKGNSALCGVSEIEKPERSRDAAHGFDLLLDLAVARDDARPAVERARDRFREQRR